MERFHNTDFAGLTSAPTGNWNNWLYVKDFVRDVPEGYRLMNSDDSGKEFGVNLESRLYVDITVDPIVDDGGYMDGLNFILVITSDDITLTSAYGTFVIWTAATSWQVDAVDALMNADFDGGTGAPNGSWNNWLYVKDK